MIENFLNPSAKFNVTENDKYDHPSSNGCNIFLLFTDASANVDHILDLISHASRLPYSLMLLALGWILQKLPSVFYGLL